MDRRSFLGAVATVGLSSSVLRAAGGPGVAYVAQPDLVMQQCAEWCWAASAAMIFTSAGHPMDQQTIVDRIYRSPATGQAECAPAQSTEILTQVLSSQWQDKNGQTFQPQIEASYDPANGKVQTDNAIILTELQQNRPLLYANNHHCMVVVEATYILTAMGPNVTGVSVLDPWPPTLPPYQPSYHPLIPPDGVASIRGGIMMYLAAVRL